MKHDSLLTFLVDWTFFIEEVSPNNKYMVRKIGAIEKQVLHRMRLRHFKGRQPIPDMQITPHDWKPD